MDRFAICLPHIFSVSFLWLLAVTYSKILLHIDGCSLGNSTLMSLMIFKTRGGSLPRCGWIQDVRGTSSCCVLNCLVEYILGL